MTRSRFLKWTAGLLLAPVLLAAALIAIFGWNWLRGPIERFTLDKTDLISRDVGYRMVGPRVCRRRGRIRLPRWRRACGLGELPRRPKAQVFQDATNDVRILYQGDHPHWTLAFRTLGGSTS